MKNPDKILFFETQKFTQWWLWAILLFVCGLSVYKLIESMFIQVADASGNVSMVVMGSFEKWIFIAIALLTIVFFALSKLQTLVTFQCITVRHLLFYKKRIKTDQILNAQEIVYGFVGYGIRFSITHGTVYNVKGNKGLLIVMKDGKKYLIGSQKSEKFEKVVKEILRKL